MNLKGILKKTLKGIAALGILSMMMVSSAFAAETVSTGHLDGVKDNFIRGWAWNPEQPDTAVTVRVVVANAATGEAVSDSETSASGYRADLEADGFGTGKYAFEVTVNWSELPAGAYHINAYIGDTKLNTVSYTNSSGTLVNENLRSLGTFKTTAYCPCYSCSEGWGRATSTGAVASAGHTIAVDPRVIPYGTQVMINGIIYTAEDRGGGVKGNHIDIFYNTHGETKAHGVQNAEVFVVEAI